MFIGPQAFSTSIWVLSNSQRVSGGPGKNCLLNVFWTAHSSNVPTGCTVQTYDYLET